MQWVPLDSRGCFLTWEPCNKNTSQNKLKEIWILPFSLMLHQDYTSFPAGYNPASHTAIFVSAHPFHSLPPITASLKLDIIIVFLSIPLEAAEKVAKKKISGATEWLRA